MRFHQGKNPGETAFAFAINKFAAYILHWSFLNVFCISLLATKGGWEWIHYRGLKTGI